MLVGGDNMINEVYSKENRYIIKIISYAFIIFCGGIISIGLSRIIFDNMYSEIELNRRCMKECVEDNFYIFYKDTKSLNNSCEFLCKFKYPIKNQCHTL